MVQSYLKFQIDFFVDFNQLVAGGSVLKKTLGKYGAILHFNAINFCS